MIGKDFFYKKFSVGLCLNESIRDIGSFLEKNKDWLNSVYFSLPLGMRFYSREQLAREYDGNDDKLLAVLDILSDLGIRREMAINTWNLASDEVRLAISYCREHGIVPEEIVCLKDYGKPLAEAFPSAEMKYSVNNPEADGANITEIFHTLVAGKGLLRDMKARHSFFRRGFNITLLLNNGCIDLCNTACESKNCRRYYDYAMDKYGLDYVYARCSFFPSELRTLLVCDEYADRYKFKISNRPIGLDYTQKVLDGYISLEDDYNAMEEDYHNLALFCTVRSLAVCMHKVDMKSVVEFKKQWMVELLRDCNRS